MGIKKSNITLSSEQLDFINHALNEENILVEACIGSGKTTAIQKLYERLKNQGKVVLYLTYNKTLKYDARNKIGETYGGRLNNYHGFAWYCLNKEGIQTSKGDLIQVYLVNKNKLEIPKYDVIIIDEYQDIDQEISEMLLHIKSMNPKIQIIAVGDMDQKIYDRTRLDVDKFIDKFLETYTKLSFTKCFRLSKDLALRLGRIWNKEIVGINNNCLVEERNISEIADILSKEACKNILCLGMRGGNITTVVNELEEKYPKKFNKNAIYATIRYNDGEHKDIPKNAAIFTTYDSSKGMERDICVVFDWTNSYWYTRLRKPDARYEIIRNVFCVAASRGKKRIIFVRSNECY